MDAVKDVQNKCCRSSKEATVIVPHCCNMGRRRWLLNGIERIARNSKMGRKEKTNQRGQQGTKPEKSEGAGSFQEGLASRKFGWSVGSSRDSVGVKLELHVEALYVRARSEEPGRNPDAHSILHDNGL